MTGSPLRWGTATATISSSNMPVRRGARRSWWTARGELVLRARGDARRRCGARWRAPSRTGRTRRSGRRSIIESTTLLVADAVAARERRAAGSGALVIDSMPPATTMSASPARIMMVGQVDASEAREADLVDRQRGHAHGDAGLDRGLAGGDLALARPGDLAHEHVVDLARVDAGPLEDAADGGAPEVLRAERGEAPDSLPMAVRLPATMTLRDMMAPLCSNPELLETIDDLTRRGEEQNDCQERAGPRRKSRSASRRTAGLAKIDRGAVNRGRPEGSTSTSNTVACTRLRATIPVLSEKVRGTNSGMKANGEHGGLHVGEIGEQSPDGRPTPGFTRACPL